MKNTLTHLIALAIFLSSISAFAQAPASAEAIIDDYFYTLTVEWDQKDQDFINQETLKFQEQIAPFLGTPELARIIKKKKNIRPEQVEFYLTQLNAHQAHAQIIEDVKSMQGHYLQGADWRGRDKSGAILIIMLLVVLFAR